MKLNWGHKLAISMTVFIGFIVTLGIIMSTNNDSIEETNYYEKGLHYDNQIEKEKNTKSLVEKPRIYFDNKSVALVITKPSNLKITATEMLLYKPNAKLSDVLVDVGGLVENEEVKIEMVNLAKGKWIAKFNWSDEERNFYMEQEFIIN